MRDVGDPDAIAGTYRGSSCLVTGGLGFIGSNLALALLEAGAETRVLDSLEPRHGGDRAHLAGSAAEVTIGDIADPALAAKLLDGVDFVFNLAGQVSHIDSITEPLRDLEINATSQLSLLETTRTVNPRARVVYSSTRQIYGRPRSLPVTEEHPIEPVDVNGVSKHAADRLHLIYHQVHELPATVLRLSNVYGPRQRLEGDHQGFLPVFVRRALAGEEIVLFGDGSQRRDCLYVDDAVSALLAAASDEDAVGEVFNIGHHDDHSLVEIAAAVTAAAGGGEVVRRPWPPGHERIAIHSFRTDHSKAERVLGWRPSWDLADGLAATVAHLREGKVGTPRS